MASSRLASFMRETLDQAPSRLNFTSSRHYRRNLLILSALAAMVYGQTLTFGFVDYDDGFYVFRNHEVLQGLNLQTIQWSITSDVAGNWHPVTWWTHLADSSIWGNVDRWPALD
jgi:protein O-mannosyl-transferase